MQKSGSAAIEVIGSDRFREVTTRLQRSEELMCTSAVEAAEALAALNMHRSNLRERRKKDLVKAAKKVRDVILWRCTACVLGLDSREAMVQAFEDACRNTAYEDDTMSQLTHSYHKLKPAIAAASVQSELMERQTASSEMWSTAFDEQPIYLFGLGHT